MLYTKFNKQQEIIYSLLFITDAQDLKCMLCFLLLVHHQNHTNSLNQKTLSSAETQDVLHPKFISSSAFQARFLGFTTLGEICIPVFVFSKLHTEAVTFCLHGWCMLGVFLLLAFTRLGHECQDPMSPCDGMHVCTDLTSVHTLNQKSFEH